MDLDRLSQIIQEFLTSYPPENRAAIESEIARAKTLISSIKIGANQTLQQALGFSNETLHFFYKTAFELNHRNEPKTALPLFHFLTYLNPLSFDYWMGLGICLFVAGNAKEAIPAFTRAKSLNPDNPKATYFIANCYLTQGDPAESFKFAKLAENLSRKARDFEYLRAAHDLQRKIINSPRHTLKLLQTIKEKKLPFDFGEKTAGNETFYTFWAGKGEAEIIRLMLELDPSVIEQGRHQSRSALVESIMNLRLVEANLLLQAMEERKIPLNSEEELLNKVLKKEWEPLIELFPYLSEDLKIKLYYLVNAFGVEEMVERWKEMMEEKPLYTSPFSTFAVNMDIITAKEKIADFLKDLRRQDTLMTLDEFSKLDNKFMQKKDQISRLQGKQFIEKIVKEHGLTHIKVPKKIAFLHEGVEEMVLYLKSDLSLRPEPNQITIYAEHIPRVDRKLSLEEAIELMVLLMKTGYRDFWGDNFIFAEDGIYIVDTAPNGFYIAPDPYFNKIAEFKKWLDAKDVDRYMEEFEKQKELYVSQKQGEQVNPYKCLVYGYQYHPFTFKVKEIL